MENTGENGKIEEEHITSVFIFILYLYIQSYDRFKICLFKKLTLNTTKQQFNLK